MVPSTSNFWLKMMSKRFQTSILRWMWQASTFDGPAIGIVSITFHFDGNSLQQFRPVSHTLYKIYIYNIKYIYIYIITNGKSTAERNVLLRAFCQLLVPIHRNKVSVTSKIILQKRMNLITKCLEPCSHVLRLMKHFKPHTLEPEFVADGRLVCLMRMCLSSANHPPTIRPNSCF